MILFLRTINDSTFFFLNSLLVYFSSKGFFFTLIYEKRKYTRAGFVEKRSYRRQAAK